MSRDLSPVFPTIDPGQVRYIGIVLGARQAGLLVEPFFPLHPGLFDVLFQFVFEGIVPQYIGTAEVGLQSSTIGPKSKNRISSSRISRSGGFS